MRQKKVQTNEFEIDFGELIYVLWKKAWIIILCAVIAGSAAFVYTTYTEEEKYTSSTSVFFVPKNGVDGFTMNAFVQGELFINDFEKVVKSNRVLEKVVSEMRLNISTTDLKKMISLSTDKNTRIVSITVTADDPYLAQDIANKLREVSAKRIAEIFEVDAVFVVDEANLDLNSIGRGTKKKTFMGAVVGAAIPSVIIAAIHLFNNTIVIPDDVENYLDLSVLGVIPYDDGKEEKKHKRRRKSKKN